MRKTSSDETMEELIELTGSAGTRPTETGVPGLSMIKGSVPKHQLAALYRPMIGFTIRGTKRLSIGERDKVMKGPSYFVLPMHVPATASVHASRDGRPYLSLGLELNQEVLQKLLRDLPGDQTSKPAGDFAACEIPRELLEALVRLLRLRNTPEDLPALAPAYEREILYRVLRGPQGGYLRRLGQREGGFAKITKTVRWLRDHYTQPIDVAVFAKESGMALGTFHRRFKEATGLSPIQFQKQLRLLEARNLMAFEGYAAAGAAYEVGYQSPSQFNREYSRFFGAPPAKDAAALRRSAGSSGQG